MNSGRRWPFSSRALYSRRETEPDNYLTPGQVDRHHVTSQQTNVPAGAGQPGYCRSLATTTRIELGSSAGLNSIGFTDFSFRFIRQIDINTWNLEQLT